MKKTKISFDDLDEIIIREFGYRRTACYDYSVEDKTFAIEVPEDCEEDAEEIIKDAGYKILSSHWFSGSSRDGIMFIIQ